jgi:hypothetical protein
VHGRECLAHRVRAVRRVPHIQVHRRVQRLAAHDRFPRSRSGPSSRGFRRGPDNIRSGPACPSGRRCGRRWVGNVPLRADHVAIRVRWRPQRRPLRPRSPARSRWPKA